MNNLLTSNDQREKFEKNFLSVPERLQDVELSRSLKALAAAEPPARLHGETAAFRRRYLQSKVFSTPLGIAAMALMALGVGLLIWRVLVYQSSETAVTLALNEACRSRRPVASRITELEYSPLSTSRGGNPEVTDRLALNRAEMIALDAAHNHPGADSHHALGRVYIAKHDFDLAIDELRRSLEIDPANAQAHTDLGVALFEKARILPNTGEKVIDLAESRSHFDRAIELNGSFTEPIFNRALWYEYMSLPGDAAKEWQHYLEKDPNSPWAREAEQRLKTIEERQGRSFQGREQVFQAFIGAYRDGEEQLA